MINTDNNTALTYLGRRIDGTLMINKTSEIKLGGKVILFKS
jgi:hypothetical protein